MERSPTIPYAEQLHTRFAEGISRRLRLEILSCLPLFRSTSHPFRSHGLAGQISRRLRRRYIFPPALPVCIVQHTESQASVHGLAPLNFRRRVTRPVSYYALF